MSFTLHTSLKFTGSTLGIFIKNFYGFDVWLLSCAQKDIFGKLLNYLGIVLKLLLITNTLSGSLGGRVL